MKKRVIFLSFVFLNVFSVSIRAQTTSPPNPRQEVIRLRNEQQAREAQRQARQREFERLRSLPENPVNLVKRDSLPFTVKPNKEQRKLLQPNIGDLARFALFLEQPKTGLIKLFPDAGCQENSRVLRVDDNCLNSSPNSAFYSFREKNTPPRFCRTFVIKTAFLSAIRFFRKASWSLWETFQLKMSRW